MSLDRKELAAFAGELARVSGEIILRFWERGAVVEYKADRTPVTAADRDSELAMRERIRRCYPGHGIVAEEYGREHEDAEYVWVLDPIDGTKSFVAGVPLFGTLIGLLERGRPILGVIHQPVLRLLCVGDNRETTLNGEPVHVRPCAALSDALVLTSGLETLAALPEKAAGWDRLVKGSRIARTWGDCYGYLLVASGRADVMVDAVVEPWDILPVIPIIRGAGGVITDWTGGDVLGGRSAVAAGPGVHAAVLQTLRGDA